MCLRLFGATIAYSVLTILAHSMPSPASGKSMVVGLNGYHVIPLLTVGDTITGTTGALNPSTAGNYTPPGSIDGLGAYELDTDTVRIFANHEIWHSNSYAYTVRDGNGEAITLSGSRVSYFDIDKATTKIVDAGIAYNKIYDANGKVATDTSFLANNHAGFSYLCSGQLVEPSQFDGRGIVDRIYFAGEEDGADRFNFVGGAVWALDPTTGHLWHVPGFGRGSWENVTELDTGTDTHAAFLLTDDTQPLDAIPVSDSVHLPLRPAAAEDSSGEGTKGVFPSVSYNSFAPKDAAPLYLYIGEKRFGDFLERNGLRDGKLYVWVANSGAKSAADFSGGGSLSGAWVEIDNNPSIANASEDGVTGFDEFGYPTQLTLWSRAKNVHAFGFSRLEDVSTNPSDGTEAVFASTGSAKYAVDNKSNVGMDTFGTIYSVKIDFTILRAPTADVTILYDGDTDMTRALRSPDNLDWSANGKIYVQEDKAATKTLAGELLFGVGAANPKEAGIVQLNPKTGSISRVAIIDRTVVLDNSLLIPTDAIDREAGNAGEWETSGILDISNLLHTAPGTIFAVSVMADGIKNQEENNSVSRISNTDLVKGGQLSILLAPQSGF